MRWIMVGLPYKLSIYLTGNGEMVPVRRSVSGDGLLSLITENNFVNFIFASN